MKILSALQVQQTDAYTIANEPIESIDLMERAAMTFVQMAETLIDQEYRIAAVCGPGNNGGDGLAVSRILLSKGYRVTPIVVKPGDGGSADFKTNLARLASTNVIAIRSENDIPDFNEFDILIDAIFGSGLTRPVTGLIAEVIDKINRSGLMVIAIDIPSGLMMDVPTTEGAIIKAAQTISFQLPKLAFVFPENFEYVGAWHITDIGLNKNFIAGLESDYQTIDRQLAQQLLVPRKKFDHKGVFGHGQLIGGSFGKMGAMILAAEAVLRTGAGLVSVNIPTCGQGILQTALPEAMLCEQKGEKQIEEIIIIEKATAVGIGPGIGTASLTIEAMGNFLRKNTLPLVIDADALNILSLRSEFMELLPEGAILTPHLKEFDRMAGESKNNWQRLEKAKEIASKYHILIVLKGAHTAVVEPSGLVFFNTTGNPGMATAGSGDILLGIITGLLTQGLKPIEAAQLGVYLHGLAGDLAAGALGQRSMIAGDLNSFLAYAYQDLER